MRSAIAAMVGVDVSCLLNLTMATLLVLNASSAVMGAPTVSPALLCEKEADPLNKRQGEGGSVSCQMSAGVCAGTVPEAKRSLNHR